MILPESCFKVKNKNLDASGSSYELGLIYQCNTQLLSLSWIKLSRVMHKLYYCHAQLLSTTVMLNYYVEFT